MTWTLAASGSKTATVAGTCTISIATPAVITMTNTCAAGDMVVFTTTGALPTGLTAGTVYFVITAGLSGSQFEVSTTAGGSAVNTTGTQSGTQTATIEHVLSSPTTNATYVYSVDTINLAVGDLVEFRVYDMVDATNFRELFKLVYQHLQGTGVGKAFPPLAMTTQTKISIKQLTGTGRAFPWSLRSI